MNAPSETSDVRPLAMLASAMADFPPGSDAWNDFSKDCRDLLRLEEEGRRLNSDVLQETWNYWTEVFAGKSAHYDLAGARKMGD